MKKSNRFLLALNAYVVLSVSQQYVIAAETPKITKIYCTIARDGHYLWSLRTDADFVSSGKATLSLDLESGTTKQWTTASGVSANETTTYKNHYEFPLKSTEMPVFNYKEFSSAFEMVGSAYLDTNSEKITKEELLNHNSSTDATSHATTQFDSQTSVAKVSLKIKVLPTRVFSFLGTLTINGIDLKNTWTFFPNLADSNTKEVDCDVRVSR